MGAAPQRCDVVAYGPGAVRLVIAGDWTAATDVAVLRLAAAELLRFRGTVTVHLDDAGELAPAARAVLVALRRAQLRIVPASPEPALEPGSARAPGSEPPASAPAPLTADGDLDAG